MSVLAACPAEAIQRISRDVITALNRYFLDGVRHILNRDLQVTVRDLDGRPMVAGSGLNFLR